MSRIFAITKILLFALLAGMTSTAFAQSDDFTTWTKFKVNHKIDSRFSVSGDLELRMKDDVSRLDRWGLTVGGPFDAVPGRFSDANAYGSALYSSLPSGVRM